MNRGHSMLNGQNKEFPCAPSLVRSKLTPREGLTIDLDRYVHYLVQQTLISNIKESYNMPKLIEGTDSSQSYATRSRSSCDEKSFKLKAKMTDIYKRGEGKASQFPQIPL